MLRREWRQQVLVVGLISFAVAAAVLGATAAYHATSSPEARFGSADHRFETAVTRSVAIESYVAEASAWFGTIELIGHVQVPVQGTTTTVQLRSMDPDGAYSKPMSAVVAGRVPTASDEIALTDGVSSTLGVGIGDRVTLGGVRWRVVGVVENPADLDDEFARVAPVVELPWEGLTLLVSAESERASSFRASMEPGNGFLERREASERTTAAVATLAVATVALVLVTLVAATSFISLAQRRMRQLGMLAAVGARSRDLRRSMVANGSAVGVVAAAVGVTVGFAVWLAVAPLLEPAAAHRIDRLDVPVWVLAACALLAIATATAAAWWPARTASKVAVTNALAARPPAPRPARRSAAAAAVMFVVGVAGIAAGVDPRADEAVPLLLIPGIIAMVAAVLLAGAPVLRAMLRVAGRLPVGARLAVRDLARYEARSTTALGAVTLGIAITVSVVVLAAAAASGSDEGNLADDQLVVWTSGGEIGRLQVPDVDAGDLARHEQDLERILGTLPPGATVIPLDVAVDRSSPEVRGGSRLLDTAVLGRRVGEDTLRDSGLVFVATPALLDHLDVDVDSIAADTLVLTRQTEDVYITGDIDTWTYRRHPVPSGQVQHLDVDDLSSTPRTLLTAAGLSTTHLGTVRAGWLIDLHAPPDRAAVARARAIAADTGLAVEVRDPQRRQTIRTVATASGVLVALSILALTAGLLRSEAGRDLGTLQATGATRRIRRTITASTCGVLAGAGTVLAICTSYTAIIAGYWPDIDHLKNIPAAHLAVITMGLPALSFALAWLFAGRDQPHLAHPPQ